MKYHEIVIVGAGASGLMCGYLLSKQGRDVLIIEKNVSAGKKLLATGNGRCNFTNLNMAPECYYGDFIFVTKVLEQFTPENALELFEEIGIYHREREGYCYPYSGQAATVVQLLIEACQENGVQFSFDTKVSKVLHKEDGYEILCKNNIRYKAKKLIFASGGKANESLGGDGSGYKLSRSMGHQVSEIYPGLTGLQAAGEEWKQLAGVRMQGKVTLCSEGEELRSEVGEIQLVKDGISGIPVFQVCRLAAEKLAKGKCVTCQLDFFPEMSEAEVANWITIHGVNKLTGLLSKKWVAVLGNKTKDIRQLAKDLKGYQVRITDTFGWEKAQVTAGGVCTEEITPATMESKIQKDLYILGELLDVDGICGGYNLHFAWATAYICSQAMK